ncbi:MAG TPA: ATPase, T2SS/T4P/T4SS family, partial [Candidatus Atribacteria bacterium]|nr:ATPase, T2SS/T4P/T4SS family [Candidatus Atribacteria bacterium]
MTLNISDLLQESVERGASDLHLTAGISPVFRIDGKLVPLDCSSLTPDDTEKFARSLAGEERFSGFLQEKELDFSLGIPQLARFRINIYQQRGSVALAIRALSYDIPSMEELHLPASTLQKLSSLPRGLILVTGPTGSGKSTTLAS